MIRSLEEAEEENVLATELTDRTISVSLAAAILFLAVGYQDKIPVQMHMGEQSDEACLRILSNPSHEQRGILIPHQLIRGALKICARSPRTIRWKERSWS